MLRIASPRHGQAGATSTDTLVIVGTMVTFRTQLTTAINSLGCRISSASAGSGSGCGSDAATAAGAASATGNAPGVRTSGLAGGLVVPPDGVSGAAGGPGAPAGLAGTSGAAGPHGGGLSGVNATSGAAGELGGAAGGGPSGATATATGSGPTGAAGGAAGSAAPGGQAGRTSPSGFGARNRSLSADATDRTTGTTGGAGLGGNQTGAPGEITAGDTFRRGVAAGSGTVTAPYDSRGNFSGGAPGGAAAGTAANVSPDFRDASWFKHNPGKVGDYAERPIDGVLFAPDRLAIGDDAKRDIRGNDVTQGVLGDCYWLSALATMAESNPDVIRNAIKDNRDGTYDVTFYDQNRQPYLVHVNNTFPVSRRSGSTPFARFSDVSRNNKQELWVQVMEKAWAKAKGGFGFAEGGYGAPAMEALTGKPSTSYSLRPNPTNAPANTVGVLDWRTLEDAARRRYAITVGSVKKDAAQTNPFYQGPNPVVAQHEYFISAVDPEKRTITVRNPWGWRKYERVMTYDEFRQAFEYVGINPDGR